MDRRRVAIRRVPVDRSVSTAAIEFRKVTFRIGERMILDDFSLEVQPGETVVLLGRSGSGKTTALKLVNALQQPTSGEVLVEGKSTAEWDVIRLRRSIGYVIQEAGLFPHFTVSRNVGLVPSLERWKQTRIDSRVAELLKLVGLDPGEHGPRLPSQLSGGQRQRVGVARALAADPRVLLFDEPFGALDPVTRLELQHQFRDWRDRLGKTSIFVTHDVREALALGSRIALLRNGRIEELGTPDEFQKSQNEEARAFLAVLEPLT